MVADAAFSNLPFVEGLREMGFSLVSRFRSNAVLHYIYEGPRTGKRVRPRTLDRKIDFRNPDWKRMKRLDIDRKEGETYELVAWSKSLSNKGTEEADGYTFFDRSDQVIDGQCPFHKKIF